MRQIFSNFSEIFSYPVAGYRESVVLLGKQLEYDKGYHRNYGQFRKFVEKTERSDIEELFTRTFDLNPSTCLEVGWHLYGEDYQRGEFLVKMRQSLEGFDIPESGELPDHLSHCLKLLTALEDDEVQIFSENYLLPAIGKILNNFSGDNPYKPVIEILKDLLEKKCAVSGEPTEDLVSAQV